jgi:hypothetical protein
MNIYEFRYIEPQFVTGPRSPLPTVDESIQNCPLDKVVAATFDEAVLIFKRNRPGAAILALTYRGVVLT